MCHWLMFVLASGAFAFPKTNRKEHICASAFCTKLGTIQLLSGCLFRPASRLVLSTVILHRLDIAQIRKKQQS